MRTGVGGLALGSTVSAVVLIILGLVSGWWAAEWLSVVAGLWVGLLLGWGAFQIFGWGRWAARPIYLWGIVGVMLVLVVLFVAGSMMFGVIPDAPAITFIFWGAFGLVLGIVATAGEIAGRTRDEDRNPV